MVKLLEFSDYGAVLQAMPHTPETLIARHAMRRRLARVYIQGTPAQYDGLVVQPDTDPAEVFGMGTAQALAAILESFNDWECIDVDLSIADALAVLLEQHFHAPVKFYGDVYHRLQNLAPIAISPQVRLFSPADEALFEVSAPEMSHSGFGTMGALLRESAAAGVVIDGKVMAIACCGSLSELYGDIYVYTDVSLRGRGFASQSATPVIQELVRRGLTPVWSCGEDNYPSLAVARKLGFVEISRRVYLIPQAAR